jgi:hypothetical protein
MGTLLRIPVAMLDLAGSLGSFERGCLSLVGRDLSTRRRRFAPTFKKGVVSYSFLLPGVVLLDW